MNPDQASSTIIEEPNKMNAETQTTPADAPQADAAHACSCNPQGQAPVEQFIYSIGRIDVRFPSIGVEREFQQRERNLAAKQKPAWSRRGERLHAVLRAHPHLARSVCFVHAVGGTPTYAVVPTNNEILQAMLDALHNVDQQDAWTLVVGRGGPMAQPTTCGGLLIQIVACDAFYSFTLNEFAEGLLGRVGPAKPTKMDAEKFTRIAGELFVRIALSMENMGAQDSHRALNFLLVQHPGPFIAAAERSERSVLDNVETRLSFTAGTRRVVSVIFTFIDRATGVPERLFTRIDVTEEWPFVADAPNGGAVPLGLYPFVDSGWQGSTLGTAI